MTVSHFKMFYTGDLQKLERNMDVEKRVAQLTAHITDPIERERKKRILLRALRAVEMDSPPENGAKDYGQFDGVRVVPIQDVAARESDRLNVLKTHRAVLFELPPEVEIIETDADRLNKRGKWGYTLLIAAVVAQDYIESRRLLDAGANWSIKDNGNMTAMDKARSAGDKLMIALLHEFGA